MAGGLELPAPEVRASIFLQTARKHSLKTLKQLGSDDPWSPCTGQSGLTEGGGGPDVRPGSRLAGPQERPLAAPTPPFPPSLATPGPPASLAQSGLPAPPRPAALQRKATSRDSRQVARPFPQGPRDKPLQEQPSDGPSPARHQRQPGTQGSFSSDIWKRRERNRKTHSNRRSEVASKGQESEDLAVL